MLLREAFLILRRNAGHSKWQNIRHTKAEKDQERSMLYTKLCQRIKVAIQENGNNINPVSNFQLAQAIENAKNKDMPVTSIQSCIKSTQVDKDAAKSYNYGIKGPRGSILLITALTRSQKKTKQDFTFYLKKIGGIMSDQSLDGNFVKKGFIVALPPADIKNIEETSIDHAIEAGAEEVSPMDDDKKFTFFCEMAQLHKVRTKLEELKYTIEDSKITLIPKMKVSLTDDELELMSRIVAKLQDLPEVVEIVDNIE